MNKQKIIPVLRFPEFVNEGEWEVALFSKYINLLRGSSPRPIQEYLTKEKSGINWIKIGDTKKAINHVINEVEEKITLSGSCKSRHVSIGDLILANSMSFGKTYLLAIDGCIYDGWFVLKEYEDNFDKKFLLHFLNSDFMQHQYKMLSAGGIVQNISSDIVYNTKIFHTSIKEQQKIADCLSSLDEVIEVEMQRLEQLKRHKKALLQTLFPQKGEKVPKLRFPEFADSGEWEEKTLGEVGVFLKGKGISKTDVVENGKTPCIRYGELYTFYKETIKDVISFTNVPIDELVLSKKNDVIIPSSGETQVDIATASCIIKDGIALGGDLNIIRTEINGLFLSYFLNNPKKQDIARMAQGISVVHLYASQLKNLIIITPTQKEQEKIADCLASLDETIQTQTERIEQLKQHKKGLLQNLFPRIRG